MTSEAQASEHRRRVIAAARLYSQGNPQKEIARLMGVAQSEVSRLVGDARKLHYLSQGPALLRGHIPDEDYAAVERQYLEREHLTEVLKRLVPRGVDFDVWMYPCSGDQFAFAAAGRVGDLLRRSRLVGIMWGRTVRQLVDGIVAWPCSFHGLDTSDIRAVPLCGDPLFLMNSRIVQNSASHLAAKLGAVLNSRDAAKLPCLVGVPAYISRKLWQPHTDRDLNSLQFLREIPGFQAIFGGRDPGVRPLIEDVDTVITGAGTIVLTGEANGNDTGDFIKERLIQGDIEKTRLNELIVGDIGGLLLPRRGLRTKDRETVEELNRGWTGIRDVHLKQIAGKARSDKKPGIILIASGQRKADLVREALRLGYVNQLIVDAELAKALGNGA